MAIKKCKKPQCGRRYKETEPEFADGYCECGGPLEEIVDTNTSNVSMPKTPPAQSDVSTEKSRHKTPKFGDKNKVILPGDPEYCVSPSTKQTSPEVSGLKASVTAFCNGEELHNMPIIFDEMEVGRESKGKPADIDLTEFDPDQRISRRHLLLFRQNNQYFVRNLSKKNSVHVGNQPLRFEEEHQLADGDLIILSGFLGIEFHLSRD